MTHHEIPKLKDLARRYSEELWAPGGERKVDELFASDYVNHQPGVEAFGISRDREGYKKLVGEFYRAFPGMRTRADEILAEGDKVCVRWSAEGKHEGSFFGIPASGRQVTLGGISILRIKDWKIAEEWSYGDQLGLMMQIGAVQPPAALAGAR